MKKLYFRVLTLGTLLALTLTLAACGPRKPVESTPTPIPEPLPTREVDELDGIGVDFLPDNAIDVTKEILGFSQDTPLFTVNGEAVTAEEYLYWLGNMTAYYQMMFAYSGGGTLDLGEVLYGGTGGEPSVTWDQQLKEVAYQNSLLLAVMPQAAAQFGIELDEGDIAELIEQRKSNIESAGGEAEYARQLQSMGIDDKTAFRLDQASALFSKLQEAYTERVNTPGDPEALSDTDVAEYLEEEGILRAKHILLLTKDMTTYEEYDDAKKAEQKAKAEDILTQLRADPSRFDALMMEYSEDSGLEAYPDGYLFGPGEMVASFEEGTKALEVGAISEIIESEFGYHIILRLDADCEESRADCVDWKFNHMMEEWTKNAVVEKAPEYDSFTTDTYYSALLDFQETLQEPEVKDMSTATPVPMETYTPMETDGAMETLTPAGD